MLIDTPFIKDPTITGNVKVTGSIVLSGSTIFTGSLKIQPNKLSIKPGAVYLTLDPSTGQIHKATQLAPNTSGTAGSAGTAGTSATGGTSGLSGYPGSSGTSGANGSTLNTGSKYPITASWAITASYALNANAGGTQLYTGSTYPITASYALYALSGGNGGSPLYTGSTYPITSSYALYALSGGTSLYTGSTYPITSSWGITASYALNSGNSLAVVFTSSFFKGEVLSAITCSAQYSYYHVSTENDLDIYVTGSLAPAAFSLRIVSSGSAHRLRLQPYNNFQWAGVASGFDPTGSFYMAGEQEIFISFIFYQDDKIVPPVTRSIAFITDLKTPGLENKTTANNLYITGEGQSPLIPGGLNDPNTFLFTANGGGTEPAGGGLSSKTFWGWMPVYVEGYGRRFIPLYY